MITDKCMHVYIDRKKKEKYNLNSCIKMEMWLFTFFTLTVTIFLKMFNATHDAFIIENIFIVENKIP